MSIIINGEIVKFVLRAKGRRLVLRSYPFYVLSLQNRFVEASFWSNIRHPWIPRPIIILIVILILRRNPTEGNLWSLYLIQTRPSFTSNVLDPGFRPLAQIAQCAVSLKSLKCLFIIIRLLSGCLRQLKNKGKVQLGNPKSGRGGLRERSLMRAFYYKV